MFGLLWVTVHLNQASAASPKKLPEVVSFNAHIRPLMSNTCFACHGPDERANESKFRIDTYSDATASLPSDASLVGIRPGDLQASQVYQRIMGAADGEAMPPADFRHQLSDYDKALIARWIEQGAHYQQHWSYTPLERPAVPQLGELKSLVANPIDAFVVDRLAQQGLRPSPVADRSTLLRRLSLDLIGLPPTEDELRSFLEDDSPNAYAKQVTRLLESPQFGERMASEWLDLVRFADTVGYHGDQNQRIFPYRDYVVQAFNRNKPFDVFTREQIAGDLLGGDQGPSAEQLTATGFLRLNMMTREGGAQPGEYLAKYKADRVRALGTVWLGITLGCCECHNHKYDPFSSKDFYSLGAFFDDLRQWGVYTTYGYTPNPDLDGFNNDYPFPPESRVESPSLKEEILSLRTERDQRVFRELPRDPQTTSAIDHFVGRLAEFLQQFPDGWAPLEIESMSSPASTVCSKLSDASVLITGPSSADAEHTFTTRVPVPMSVSAIRLEVLPDASNGGFVGRSDDGRFTVSVTAKLHPAAKETGTPLTELRPQIIRIELPGKKKILSLAEVQVMVNQAGILQNIAPLGKASQISTDPNGDANHAIDGNTNGNYHQASSVTHNQECDDPWWELDLGAPQKLDSIVLWNRTDGEYGNRLKDYRIQLLDGERRTLRTLEPKTPNPSLSIDVPETLQSESVQSIEFAWIEADRFMPLRYQNGAPPRTISGEWHSGPTRWQFPNEAALPHTALFHFSRPVDIGANDRLMVRLSSKDIGRVRVSVSPIAHATAGWPAVSEDLQRALSKHTTQRSESEQALCAVTGYLSTTPVASQVPVALKYRDAILDCHSGLAMTMIARSLPVEAIPISRVRPRGNWQDESGDLAPPEFPAFLQHQTSTSDSTIHSQRLTRLDLADWLVSPTNPLTARHFVNRTWKRFFGTGISAKLDDLGNQGEWPSHPELLDWLAAEFIASNWNVKHMLQLMVTSRTYQQQAGVRDDLRDVDPYNRLLSQQTPRRLEAEAIRDQALAVSGLLNLQYVGGPSIFPYQPDGHYSNIQFPDRRYDADTTFRQYRRSVYMHWQRTFLHPMLVNFDAPSRDECTAERSTSNSPQQALTLLNDPEFVEASHAFARRLVAQYPDRRPDQMLDSAFQKTLSRSPDADEIASLISLFERQRAYYMANVDRAEQFLNIGNTQETVPSDLAELSAWSQVCRVILNLHETITRY
jgi:hypothetical protein